MVWAMLFHGPGSDFDKVFVGCDVYLVWFSIALRCVGVTFPTKRLNGCF